MKILGIETSCDETAAAVVEDGSKILANIVASSLPLHAKSGGIIPEVAAREQVKAIIPVVEECLSQTASRLSIGGTHESIRKIDAIAVTIGPGLIGSLLVGVEAAKALAYVWKKPVIPVNHLLAHLYSPWLENPQPPKFPLIALIVSGGHTELFFVPNHGRWQHLGGTRDDAAGEAFDKTARLLNLGYPGGPAIEQIAYFGNWAKFYLPRPLIDSPDFDFSFSGLKTAVVNLVDRLAVAIKNPRYHNKRKIPNNNSPNPMVADLASSIQEAVVDVLVSKAVKAANKFNVENIVLGGGVAANKRLREEMVSRFRGTVYFSSPNLAIDNAAMVAAAAFFNYQPVSWRKVSAEAGILI